VTGFFGARVQIAPPEVIHGFLQTPQRRRQMIRQRVTQQHGENQDPQVNRLKRGQKKSLRCGNQE